MDLTKGNVLGPKEVVWSEVPWARNVAAGSLVAGAVLLVAGHKRTALAVASAGAAVALLEKPEAAQELWAKLPEYIHAAQDFLVRAEGTIERLAEQAAKLKDVVGRVQG